MGEAWEFWTGSHGELGEGREYSGKWRTVAKEYILDKKKMVMISLSFSLPFK